MKVIKTERSKIKVTLEINGDELEYLWHRLNMSAYAFETTYKKSCPQRADEYRKIHISGLWNEIDKILQKS